MVRSDEFSWIEALPDGAVVVDKGGAVVCVNLLACDILQTNPRGLPIQFVIRAPALASALEQIRRTGTSTTVDIGFHDRLHRQVNAWLSRIGGGDHILIVLRDLTREQAVEKMRSDFVANASHEMRTPLTVIMGAIETMQGPARNDVKARDNFLATMLSQAQRMKRLIDDLLTLSRIELHEHVRPNSKVSLTAIANQATSQLLHLATKSNVSLVSSAQDQVGVSGDADELLQVALNLIENAIKYGGAGGRVEITCEIKGREGLLIVKDFGQGIAPEHIPRLTERFYRVSNKESRARGGTGLGLAICKHIIKRHRGRLNIASEVGKGSAFSVALPLAD